MRHIFPLVLAAFLLLSAVLPSAAQGQPDWTCFYDFRVSDHFFLSGRYMDFSFSATRDADGWHEGENPNSHVGINIGAPISTGSVTATKFIVDYSWTGGTSPDDSLKHFLRFGSQIIWEMNALSTPPQPLIVTGNFTGDIIDLTFFAGFDAFWLGTQWTGGDVNIRSLTMEGIGTPPTNCPAQTLNANFTATPTSGPAPLTVNFTNTSTGAVSYLWHFGDGSTSTNPQQPRTYTTPGTYTVTLTATDAGGATDTHTATITVGYDPLTRPIAAPDRLFAFQSIRTTGPLADVLARQAAIFGAKSNAMVSAVIDGTVTRIEPLTGNKCFYLFQPIVSSLPDTAAARDNCRVTIKSQTGSFTAGEHVHLFSTLSNPPPAYVITIAGVDGREYLQITGDTSQYVFEGQQVKAGCWLGKALPLPDAERERNTVQGIAGLFNGPLATFISFISPRNDPFQALTAVWVRTEDDDAAYVNAFTEYALDPSDAAPCNSPAGFEGCMGDSELEDASQWQSSNGVSWLQPGALVPPGDYISSTFNLDGVREPGVIIGSVSQPNTQLLVEFGDASEWVNILGTETNEFPAGQPDAGDFYTLRVSNDGETPMRLDFVCVIHGRDASGSPNQRPTNPNDRGESRNRTPGTEICFFKNSSFETGREWDISGGAAFDDGQVRLPDDASIEQDVELPAGSYSLAIVAELWTTAAFVLDEDDASNGVQLEYAYPGATFASIGTQSWGSWRRRVVTYRTTITLASAEDEPFTIRANIINAPAGVRGLGINSACLTRTQDLDEDGEGDGDGDGLIRPTCGTIAVPPISATQPGTWSTWLWANLNKFFRCELIKVINSIYTSMMRFFQTATWMMRWSQAAVMRGAGFASNSLYWLNGHLHNIAVGYVYVVANGQSIDESGDIGDVLLGGLKSVIDVFVDVLRRLIEFFFWMLNLVFVLALDIVLALIRVGVLLIGLVIGALGQFFDVVRALFFAWNNSTPQAIAGVPQCAIAPKEFPACIVLWMLENTIFSGRGFLFIPFFIAYGSAELLLWAVSKLARNAESSAKGG